MTDGIIEAYWILRLNDGDTPYWWLGGDEHD